jgi:hypothetical protein
VPDRPDDIDEEDSGQPVVDVEANIELGQLRGSVEDIARQLGDLASALDRSFDIMLHTVNDRLNRILTAVFAFEFVVVAGIVAIVGTLRHWF